MQRALMQYFNPVNRRLVMEALKKLDREDLIGWGANCLIPPYEREKKKKDASGGKPAGAKKTPVANAKTDRSREKKPKHGGNVTKNFKKPSKSGGR